MQIGSGARILVYLPKVYPSSSCPYTMDFLPVSQCIFPMGLILGFFFFFLEHISGLGAAARDDTASIASRLSFNIRVRCGTPP